MSSDNYRIVNQHSVYFLTFTVTDWVDVFVRLNYKTIIADSLSYCRQHKGLILYAWCLMTNHLHLICRVEEPFRMSDFIRDFKSFTAKKILEEIHLPGESRRDWMLYRFEFAGKFDRRIQKYRFWQDKSLPIELISTDMLDQRLEYLHQNPVRSGIVAEPEDYLYSSARNYAGLSAIIEVDML